MVVVLNARTPSKSRVLGWCHPFFHNFQDDCAVQVGGMNVKHATGDPLDKLGMAPFGRHEWDDRESRKV